MDNRFPILNIDNDFKNLIRPLHQIEYLQLEENLLTDGCREPLVTWKGFIIDGHNRYAICNKHKIPYTHVEMTFETKDEVIAWICKNQLGRRNITEETRKFLIGKQYNAEKIINRLRNQNGTNQYSNPVEDYIPEEETKVPSCHKTADKIAGENNVTRSTVQKYSAFATALNTIEEKEPELASRILSGRYKISHNNLLTIAKMPASDIKNLSQRMINTENPFMRYSKTRNIVKNTSLLTPTPAIKEMPAYDADARIVELTLTIPSWTSSIIRARNNSELNKVSLSAKEKLIKELSALSNTANELLNAIQEE